jgi:hypothetical protein
MVLQSTSRAALFAVVAAAAIPRSAAVATSVMVTAMMRDMTSEHPDFKSFNGAGKGKKNKIK